MADPREIFDAPLSHLDFLQSADFEGQYFERKEIRIETRNQINALKERIRRCISSFANSNRAGGLLVLGIADDGTLTGTQHVDEQTMNGILQALHDLDNHATEMQVVDVPVSEGNRLHLFYTYWTPDAICETRADFPRSWCRVGAQSLPLRPFLRDRLQRDKGVIDFETLPCGPYHPEELDKDVLEEFKSIFLAERGAQFDYSTEELLLNIGAITRRDGGYAFTNAGYLFFADYPRRRLASAFVRVLRFEVPVGEARNRGATTFDKDFDGPLPTLIRKLRTFFRDSALFRTIIRRSDNAGFIEDPEYPLFVLDEALVNAAIHKDYGATNPIHYIAYKDGLVVTNPGSIPQEVPRHFSLADVELPSVLRNSIIAEWMRLMKDERGEPLVRALSEGTRKMRQEMEKLGLPPPIYETDADTTVTFYNRFEERLVPHAYINAARAKPSPQRRGQLPDAMRVIGERMARMG